MYQLRPVAVGENTNSRFLRFFARSVPLFRSLMLTPMQFYRSLQLKMEHTECLIHVDFSENYTSKLAREIQSMHFGASKKQITLHTGVMHVGAGGKPLTFCSLSDNCEHGPLGIWTHLRPVLDDLKTEHPAVNIVHFFSDSPCTQYRQKMNFLLFSNDLANRGIQFGKQCRSKFHM